MSSFMTDFDETIKTGEKLASCIKKNCDKASGMLATMEAMRGMHAIVTDMRKLKDPPSAEKVRGFKKRVEALKGKVDAAQMKAEDAMCAIKSCGAEWEAWANTNKKLTQARFEGMIRLLDSMEKYLDAPAKKAPAKKKALKKKAPKKA